MKEKSSKERCDSYSTLEKGSSPGLCNHGHKMRGNCVSKLSQLGRFQTLLLWEWRPAYWQLSEHDSLNFPNNRQFRLCSRSGVLVETSVCNSGETHLSIICNCDWINHLQVLHQMMHLKFLFLEGRESLYQQSESSDMVQKNIYFYLVDFTALSCINNYPFRPVMVGN